MNFEFQIINCKLLIMRNLRQYNLVITETELSGMGFHFVPYANAA